MSDSSRPGRASQPSESACGQRPDVRSVPGASWTNDGQTEPPPEPEMVSLDPRVRTLWWTAGLLQAVLITMVVAPVDVFAPLPTQTGVLTSAVGGVGVALALIIPVIRYRRWGYALREGDLWIRQGVLWVTVSVIPYARLQFVDTRQGPLDRLFGLSQLVVHTAALGTSGRLPGLDAEEAEHLRERLAAVESDVVAV